MDIGKALKEPFKASQIKWRVGSTNSDKTKGMALAYIEARDAMNRLDQVVGPFNWKDEYEKIGDLFICRVAVRADSESEWIWKTDGAETTAVEAEKGGLSDAFKRACVKWGIGRYLYYLPSKWVALNQYKQIIEPPALPAWALPKEDK